MPRTLRYFLEANSPGGCVSRFDQLGIPGSWRCWVVTGGSARLRARLMDRVGRAMAPLCGTVEEILSLEDPDRLTAAIFPGRQAAVADGELSGAILPRCPGGYQRPVSLWPCVRHQDLWEARRELLRLEEARRGLARDAGGYLYAAGAMLGDLASVGAAALDRGKLRDYARRLARREFPSAPRGRGREQVRFLSALTGKGPVLLTGTAAALCPRVIAIEDGWGAASNALLEALRELALEAGLEVISCRCPLFPFTKLEHLLLPRLGLGIVTLNPSNAAALKGLAQRQIHATRFCDREQLRARRERSRFLRRGAAGMLEQAGALLTQREALGRELDGIYDAAVDTDRAEAAIAEIVAEAAG